MKRFLTVALAIALGTPALWAGGLAGVVMDDRITVGEDTLKLNGMGLRKKAVFKVYVGGLYLEHPTTNGINAAESRQVKRMVMHFLTNKATKKKMDKAWIEGFKENYAGYAEIEPRVRTFKDYFGDMKIDDVVEITLVPGEGTTVVINGSEKGRVEGDDFAEALVKVWVGPSPPTEAFKKGLLGG